MSADNRRDRQRRHQAEDVRFAEELQRRLDVIEADDYVDPARRDLPALDLVVVAVVAIAVIVLVHLWGF